MESYKEIIDQIDIMNAEELNAVVNYCNYKAEERMRAKLEEFNKQSVHAFNDRVMKRK